MKQYKFIALLLILSIALPGYSQLQQYIDDVDVLNMNGAKYQGKKYLFYNTFLYDGAQHIPPMPFRGDRIRDGKYKASATAMNNYIEEFKKNSGKSYTFVKFFPSTQQVGQNGAVFVGELGDTVFVEFGGIKEFYSVEALEYAKTTIGHVIYEKDPIPVLSSFKNTPTEPFAVFYTYSDAKTKELKPSFLPIMSEWTCKDVYYDTTYYGGHNPYNDAINTSVLRTCYVLDNKRYGTLICYCTDTKHTASKEEAYKAISQYIHWEMGYKLDNYTDEDLKLIEQWAKDGTPDMKYYSYMVKVRKEGKYYDDDYRKKEFRESLFRFAKEGSVLAAYELTYKQLSSPVPLDELSEVVMNLCKPITKNSFFAEMSMTMGEMARWAFPDCPISLSKKEKKEYLDHCLSLGKEWYKLAEAFGVDSRDLAKSRAKLEDAYADYLERNEVNEKEDEY